MSSQKVAENVAYFLATGKRWHISAADFLTAYAAGVRDFRGASLYGASLTDASLYGASLYGASLDGANLRSASLTDASLTDASLYGANLDGANLDGATLTGANLTFANLDGATLTGANLTGATLDGADLSDADIRRCVGALGSSFSLFRSAGNRSLNAAVDVADGRLVLLLQTGCTRLLTPEEMRAKVETKYGANGADPNALRLRLYEAAIVFAEASFAAIVESGKLNYLIELAAKEGNE